MSAKLSSISETDSSLASAHNSWKMAGQRWASVFEGVELESETDHRLNGKMEELRLENTNSAHRSIDYLHAGLIPPGMSTGSEVACTPVWGFGKTVSAAQPTRVSPVQFSLSGKNDIWSTDACGGDLPGHARKIWGAGEPSPDSLRNRTPSHALHVQSGPDTWPSALSFRSWPPGLENSNSDIIGLARENSGFYESGVPASFNSWPTAAPRSGSLNSQKQFIERTVPISSVSSLSASSPGWSSTASSVSPSSSPSLSPYESPLRSCLVPAGPAANKMEPPGVNNDSRRQKQTRAVQRNPQETACGPQFSKQMAYAGSHAQNELLPEPSLLSVPEFYPLVNNMNHVRSSTNTLYGPPMMPMNHFGQSQSQPPFCLSSGVPNQVLPAQMRTPPRQSLPFSARITGRASYMVPACAAAAAASTAGPAQFGSRRSSSSSQDDAAAVPETREQYAGFLLGLADEAGKAGWDERLVGGAILRLMRKGIVSPEFRQLLDELNVMEELQNRAEKAAQVTSTKI
eukprot:CAMPEP_0196652600 /NCGR_PEP_ID=MMETSP1086-20130531/1931_1 /TAXON_ID=77921 /ORGANISM="Cyanoptyche  gloeocystis , Strain SAG4.97" /LENGTH=514 /DNA_ID=CAMNT_0041983229 /DNA_START=150 /DNA_END=1694 /DNA_ORIENTATION=+